ncbi:MAG TPA: hypothetical protein VEL28_23045 [Candidatus Binatia bacterium]|nr:hypothetical protein [Candidatus Binatia bacterium]
MYTRFCVAFVTISVVVLAAGTSAHAQASPDCASKCLGMYQKVVSTMVKCATKALAKAGTNPAPCMDAAQEKMILAWAKAQNACGDMTCDAVYPGVLAACENTFDDLQDTFGTSVGDSTTANAIGQVNTFSLCEF